MRFFIFWWIIVPSVLAFILGLSANIAQRLANKPDESSTETPATNDTSAV